MVRDAEGYVTNRILPARGVFVCGGGQFSVSTMRGVLYGSGDMDRGIWIGEYGSGEDTNNNVSNTAYAVVSVILLVRTETQYCDLPRKSQFCSSCPLHMRACRHAVHRFARGEQNDEHRERNQRTPQHPREKTRAGEALEPESEKIKVNSGRDDCSDPLHPRKSSLEHRGNLREVDRD